MKYVQDGKRGLRQGWRFIASTIVGEGFDSLIFMSVGFLGIMEVSDLVKTILTIWGVKVLYEILVLPLSLPFANWVKKVEGIDEIDKPETTSYNPFTLK